eukprot:TRINITY_DN1950_c0_g1_i4.p1 TRINITY_DN1950_c0_g1~~TRINITY_DN1950_c0_g1_i4.p1  ORF type:complete len:309 (+),score=36.22 TRINITY_DN1950_c0_g1_i4:79-1005(+)
MCGKVGLLCSAAVLVLVLVLLYYHSEEEPFAFMQTHHDIDSLKTPSGDKRNYFVNSKGMWIFTKIWLTKKILNGLVFIVHDLGEHSGVPHYRPLISELTEQGYSVFMIDLQGHGRSNGERMYFEYFEDLVDDYQQFMILVFQDYPKETPFFMLGHGFGGHIALQLGLRIERGFKGVILSSVPLRNLESFGEGYSSWLLELGSLFPKLNYGYLYETSMLMRNKESLQQAYTDPRYYTGPIKIRPFCEILHNFDDIQENLNWIDWPILSLRGSSDPSLAPENTRDFFNGKGSFPSTEDTPEHRYSIEIQN